MDNPGAPSKPLSSLQIARDLVLDLLHDGGRGLGAIDAHIFAGVLQANIDAATATPEGQRAYGGLSAPPPDALRRKVSINRLAQSLDLPFETVRRRLKALVEQGRIEMQPGGAMVTSAYLSSDESRAAVLAVDALARRAFNQLDAIGFFAAHPLPAPGAAPDEHPYRAVARLVTDYCLRIAQILQEVCGDYTNSLLILQLSRRCDGFPAAPASAIQVARDLAIPTETARRRLALMARQGICEQTGGGYRIDIHALGAGDRVASGNDMNLARLFRGCIQIGAAAGWTAAANRQVA